MSADIRWLHVMTPQLSAGNRARRPVKDVFDLGRSFNIGASCYKERR
jgi:hypothetical protein